MGLAALDPPFGLAALRQPTIALAKLPIFCHNMKKVFLFSQRRNQGRGGISVRQSHSIPKPHAAGELNGQTPDLLSQRVLSLRLPDSPAFDGSGRRRWVWAIGLLLAAALLPVGYFALRSHATWRRRRQPRRAVAQQAPVAKRLAPAIALEAKGYIIPVHQILVSPKVNGMIVRLPIQEGMRIKKGDVVAELEDTDYRADYQRAVASLDAARQTLLDERDSAPKRLPRPRPTWPSPRRSWTS